MSEMQAIETLTRAAAEAGVRFEVDWDLAAFAEAKAAMGLGSVTPIFESARDMGPGFWIPVREIADGTLVGLQAVRFSGDLTPNLWAHILAYRDLYLPVGMGIDPACSEVHSAVAREMSGSVAYHGEFFLLPTTQGRGLGPILFRLAHVVAWQAFTPDVFFGLTGNANTNPGFAHKMGYQSFELGAVTWRDARGGETEVEGLVWSGPTRMRQLSADPLGDLEVVRGSRRAVR